MRILIFAALVAALPTTLNYCLLKLGPEEFRLVREDAKWDLKRTNINFIDYTKHAVLDDSQEYVNVHNPQRPLVDKHPRPAYSYPKKVSYAAEVTSLFNNISIQRLTQALTTFSSFYTRHYTTEHGLASANWLFQQLQETVDDVPHTSIHKIHHKGWDQYSIVVRVTGASAAKVILGSHQDSTNFHEPETSPAPGADDDGSGVVTVLETLRVLSESIKDRTWTPHNTIEFHFYSAEEAGLLGSMDVFAEYAAQGAYVAAMVQFDETGSPEKSLSKGIERHFGLMSDYVSVPLNEFLKLIINSYNDIPYHETKCGFACSDHASAYERGYPSTFVTESEGWLTSEYIHTEKDTVDRIDFGHIAEHVKLGVAYLYELGSAIEIYQ